MHPISSSTTTLLQYHYFKLTLYLSVTPQKLLARLFALGRCVFITPSPSIKQISKHVIYSITSANNTSSFHMELRPSRYDASLRSRVDNSRDIGICTTDSMQAIDLKEGVNGSHASRYSRCGDQKYFINTYSL